MYFELSSAKFGPFCGSLNVLAIFIFSDFKISTDSYYANAATRPIRTSVFLKLVVTILDKWGYWDQCHCPSVFLKLVVSMPDK